MPELISRAQANAVFGVGLPFLALFFALVLWKPQPTWARLLAVAGMLTGVLWWIFNAILDRTGPESIGGLSLCALLFIVAGVGLGLLLRRPDVLS